MDRKFQRKKENFVCDKCGAKVKGSGYTNHCPHCLYSKHVDVYPGDRAEECHGLMAPVDYHTHKGEIVITFQCVKCGFRKDNKMQAEDDFDALQKVIDKKIYG